MADDHAIVRKGFHALLEQAEHIRIVAECDTTQGARDALLTLAPDLLVLDISLPGGGLELLRQMQAMPGTPPVLILSMHVGEPYVSEALRLGAAGYVSKSTAADELLPAIDGIMAGQTYLSSDLRNAPPASLSPGPLSQREHEIFLRLANGHTPKQVALDLGISVKTAYLHRASIRQKLGVHNDLQLHRLALAHGLLDHTSR